jgi:hypothetical protein
VKKTPGAISLFINMSVGMAFLAHPAAVFADQASTIAALRMNGNVTGGLMPTSSPQFTQMVTYIQSGDYYDAAMAAVNTPYFGAFLARRMAKEMQNVTLTSSGVPDNDSTAFLVAHFLHGTTATNTGVTTGISGLWSDNVTCLVDVGGTNTSAFKLTATQLAAVNWATQIVCTPGQTGSNAVPGSGKTGTQVAIPAADVGGYMTLSLAPGDSSFAQNAFTAGTNLRGVEYLYEISMGVTLLQLAIQDGATPQVVAPFVPEGDPNFLVGVGQPACISCHGGGAQAVQHGYSTLADLFNFDPTAGFEYVAAPTAATMKSYGSNSATRANVQKCVTNHAFPTGFTTCNPDSIGASTTQAWDLSSWQQGGILQTMGWSANAPISGNGLNTLGAAVGQAALVYQFMTSRVIGEICPLGSVTTATQNSIASEAQTGAIAASHKDSLGYIVASVASDPSCR